MIKTLVYFHTIKFYDYTFFLLSSSFLFPLLSLSLPGGKTTRTNRPKVDRTPRSLTLCFPASPSLTTTQTSVAPLSHPIYLRRLSGKSLPVVSDPVRHEGHRSSVGTNSHCPGPLGVCLRLTLNPHWRPVGSQRVWGVEAPTRLKLRERLLEVETNNQYFVTDLYTVSHVKTN